MLASQPAIQPDFFHNTNMNKDEAKIDLKKSYIKPGHPIAFSGVHNVYDYYNKALSLDEIREILSEIENYTLHREFHKSQRNISYSHFKRYQFQMDLVDVQQLAKYNDNVNYWLTCIDTFTRYAFVRLLRSKQSENVLYAFKSILEEAVDKPFMVVVDRGTEFYNKDFKKYCDDNNILFYSPDSSIHGAYIERFNRSLQAIVYKYMTEYETHRYIDMVDEDGTKIDLMPRFVATYNNRRHRMINIPPYMAETMPEFHEKMRKLLSLYYEKVKKQNVKFNVGDTVRISKIKGKFSRGYNERASQEIFKIHEVKTNLKIPMYVLSNYRGDEIIKGSFYASELIKVSGDNFRVEKVIKKRKIKGKTQLLVKWKGFDDSYNSWINEDQVTQKF